MLQYIKNPKVIIPVIVLILATLIFFYAQATGPKQVATAVAKSTALQQGANNLLLSDNQGNLSQIAFPKGIVVIWSGSVDQIPSGWALCDGTNGTPDLRTKFLLGINKGSDNASYRTIGGTGGSETHTLTTTEIPKLPGSNIMQYPSLSGGSNFSGSGYKFQHDKNYGNTDGSTSPHNNMPPYYTVAYIMKL